ncbi:MAG: outer membrane beta-barrel domain-containing protein [Gammaproteobacteria bacterium]|nr:outer membrane beta-barrel domain-containing protein [Gammaproteobacteria bacterium]
MEVRFFILFLIRLRKEIIGMSLVLLTMAATPLIAAAQEQPQSPLAPTDAPLIQPEVERKEIIDAKIDTEDFEVGFFGGLYSTEDFGTNSVIGATFSYHVTEDFFFQLAAGETETQKSSVERLGFFDILNDDERTLQYYNLSLGYNILPGEAFMTSNWAFYTAFYFIAGIGNTHFAAQDNFTINFGAGFRFIATDWMAFHVDMRDHIFDLDILGEEQTTHNLEMSLGITFFF